MIVIKIDDIHDTEKRIDNEAMKASMNACQLKRRKYMHTCIKWFHSQAGAMAKSKTTTTKKKKHKEEKKKIINS